MASHLSNSISRKSQSPKRQAPVPANKKLKRAEVLKLDKVPIRAIIFQRASFLTETNPVDLVNPFYEPQGNYIISASCGVSPSGVFAATDSPRLPFFEIEFLYDVLFRFPIFFNWRHKLKFENPRLLYAFVHQYIKSTTNSHVIIVYIILSMPSTSQFTCSCVTG